jgi:hypothetical protein
MAENNSMRQAAASLIMAHKLTGDKTQVAGVVARVLRTPGDVKRLEELANALLDDQATAQSLAEVMEERLHDPKLGQGLDPAQVSLLKTELRKALDVLNKKIDYLGKGFSPDIVKDLPIL